MIHRFRFVVLALYGVALVGWAAIYSPPTIAPPR